MAIVREEWRAKTKQGLAYFEEERTSRLQEARERRHRAVAAGDSGAGTTDYDCPECGLLCASRIGLLSHIRAHRRRKAERAIIVGNNGLP